MWKLGRISSNTWMEKHIKLDVRNKSHKGKIYKFDIKLKLLCTNDKDSYILGEDICNKYYKSLESPTTISQQQAHMSIVRASLGPRSALDLMPNLSEWVLAAQSCPALCDPMDCSLPGFFVYGILQAGIVEWVAIPFSRGSSQLRDQIQVSWWQVDSLPSEPPRKPYSIVCNINDCLCMNYHQKILK